MASYEDEEVDELVEKAEETALEIKDIMADNSYKGKMSIIQGELIFALLFINVAVLYALLAVPGEKVGGAVYSAFIFAIICILLQLVIGVIVAVLVYKPNCTEKDRNLFEMLNNAVIGLAAVLSGFTVLVMSLYIAAAAAPMPATKILQEGDEDLPLCM